MENWTIYLETKMYYLLLSLIISIRKQKSIMSVIFSHSSVYTTYSHCGLKLKNSSTFMSKPSISIYFMDWSLQDQHDIIFFLLKIFTVTIISPGIKTKINEANKYLVTMVITT